MSDDIAIKVENVSKTFMLPHEKNNSIKSAMVRFRKRKKSYEKQLVLDNISFEVKKGEFFGIVGRNGSGKSTMLKMLAGIYNADKGTIKVNGKLTPFIELGVGFSPELSGRENVFLNGALLGFNRKEMDNMYDDIVNFAELGEFMDQKLKNYSSGMQVRLAFSIAIRAKTEILIIDEVLAVGDSAFQKKCYAVFKSLKREGRTVVFVTHGMMDVERFCDRVLVLDKGVQKGIFNARDARIKYEKMNQNETDTSRGGPKESESRWGNGPVKVDDIILMSDGKEVEEEIESGNPLEVLLKLKLIKKPQEHEKFFVVGMNIFSEDGDNLFGPNTTEMKIPIDTRGVKLTIPSLPLNKGRYFVTVVVYDEHSIEAYDTLDRVSSFDIVANNRYYGALTIDHRWSIEEFSS